MTKKLAKETSEPKFTIKKREPKPKPDYFQNVTPFSHPLSEIINFPALSESHDSDGLGFASPELETFLNVETFPVDETTNPTNTTDITNTTGITINNDTFSGAPRLLFVQKTQPVSPIRDFTKTPNSINRIIQAQGLFRGKSKQIYDYLWAVSRGAIRPSRTVRCTHGAIKRGAGIGSRNTVIDGLKHLSDLGLIGFVSSVGVNEGNEYEIFTPEEAGYTSTTNTTGIISTTRSTGITAISQIPDVPVYPDYGITDTTQAIDNKHASGNDKTLLKTNGEEIDDERCRAAFIDLEKVLNQAVENITGRKTSESDRERWKHVADILATQLELIASRTTISNAPAVLAEHLHRQLNSQRALERIGLITPKDARAAKRESIEKQSAQAEEAVSEETTSEETITDLYLCPDCDGTTYWNPDGKGRQGGCPHSRLEEAREQARAEGEQQLDHSGT